MNPTQACMYQLFHTRAAFLLYMYLWFSVIAALGSSRPATEPKNSIRIVSKSLTGYQKFLHTSSRYSVFMRQQEFPEFSEHLYHFIPLSKTEVLEDF